MLIFLLESLSFEAGNVGTNGWLQIPVRKLIVMHKAYAFEGLEYNLLCLRLRQWRCEGQIALHVTKLAVLHGDT